MTTPGVEVKPIISLSGEHIQNDIFFTDVRVPKANAVGRIGEGWTVANVILKNERDSLADPDQAQARLNAIARIMQEETVDGRRVADDPVFVDRLMRLQGRAMSMQYNALRVLSASLNRDEDALLARLVVKLQGTELRHEIEGLAIDVMGERGLAYGSNPYVQDDGTWQFWHMFYLGLIIGGGTSQIQKNIISERGLGMPREPGVR